MVLYCEISPPDTTVGRDVVESIKRGDLDGMSFGFVAVDESWGSTEDGQQLRELREVRLYDVSRGDARKIQVDLSTVTPTKL